MYEWLIPIALAIGDRLAVIERAVIDSFDLAYDSNHYIGMTKVWNLDLNSAVGSLTFSSKTSDFEVTADLHNLTIDTIGQLLDRRREDSMDKFFRF